MLELRRLEAAALSSAIAREREAAAEARAAQLARANQALAGSVQRLEEALGKIARGLDRSAPSHRRVVFLRDIQGLGIVETSQHLGISCTAVRALHCRARAAMRAVIGCGERPS